MNEPVELGFRRAMRTLTSAVTVISTDRDGRRFGMVATAVTSLSMEPPSLLACVNTSASIHEPLLESGSFCVNILHANQTDIVDAFTTKKGEERFLAGDWIKGWHAMPCLVGAQANVLCEVEGSYSHGTHRIFVGLVREVLVRQQVNPLLYQDGRYTVGLGAGVDWVVPCA